MSLANAPQPPVVATPLWRTIALAALVVLVPYLPAALGAEFLRTFDDNFYFGPDNPEFRAGLGTVLDPDVTIANVYLPVAHVSLWLDYWFGGGSPLLPHLVSMVWHAAAVVVAVRLLLAVGCAAAPAHAAGVLFALHPALAESVAWVSGRKDLLSFVAMAGALLAAVRFARRPSPSLWLAVAALQAVAMYAKATAVVAPLLAVPVLAACGPERRRWWAWFALLATTLPIAWHHQAIAAAQGTMVASAVGERLAQVPGAFGHYLGVALWPHGLNVLYPEVVTLERFRDQFAVGAAALLGFAVVVVLSLCRPNWRGVGLACLAFALALAPFNTAFPASSIAAADRYLYMAVPALATALALGLWRVLPNAAAWAVVGLLAAVATFATGQRAKEFGDDERIWQASLDVDGDNAVAHLNLVHARLARGPAELRAVRDHLDAALAASRYPVHSLRAAQLAARIALVDGDYPAAAAHARAAMQAGRQLVAGESDPLRRRQAEALLVTAQLAAIEPLRLVRDEAGAEAAWQAAKELVPDHAEVVAFGAVRELREVLAELQAKVAEGGPTRLADDDPRFVAAVARLDAAVAAAPKSAALHCALAEWYRAADRAFRALHAYRQAMEGEPDRIDGWLGAARLLREREQYVEAADYARNGLARRQDPALQQELALALVGQGRLDEAVAHLEACLKLAPDDQDVAKVLANVLVVQAYSRLGKQEATHEQILAAVERALQLNPRELKAHLVLGLVRREQQRYAEAVEHLETAHRLLPTFAEAKEKLVQSLLDLGYQRRLGNDEQGAAAAWLRARELAPESIAGGAVELQLQALWRRCEQRGVAALKDGNLAVAADEFRSCLRIDPAQHWAAWLLAQTLHRTSTADAAEIERLCRIAIDGQARHGLDRSKQVYLLATTLQRRGDADGARREAAAYLAEPDADATAETLAALQRIAAR